MGDQTHTALDSLLGLLASAIKNEVKLQRSVKRDILFIKDEMDSMNGFLLHLTKTETVHNDQHRAWMKQVREIAYAAQDSIQLYMRDLSPPGARFWHRDYIKHLPTLLRTCPKRHRLAKRLHELKDRVREVGERRLRYGVSVPDAKPKPEAIVKDSTADEERGNFLRALAEEELGRAISLLHQAGSLPSGTSEKEIQVILDNKCVHIDSKKMLLRALYAFPNVTKEELDILNNKLAEGRRAADVSKEVMLLSYSKLSAHYKSCLQYVTAFFAEESISRTILIRRWVAEGLVASVEEFETMEEAGERCFDELVFRGFVQPVPPVVPGVKIKSCQMEELVVREFVIDIAKSENFVAGGLPKHLQYQQEIRKLARQSTTTKAAATASRLQIWCPWNICPRKPHQDDDGIAGASKVAEDKQQQHPMDEMVHLLKTLPELYRLNVLDLGGCKGLTEWRLVSICKAVPSLKYLSLRSTDVSQLPKNIDNLKQLETLDIRQTNITTVDDINLPNLKHLLAGHIPHCPPPGNKTDELPLTVPMPNKIGLSMEILRHVQIIDGKADRLERVGQQLRKLGVVLNGSEDDMKHLFRAITRSSECLRSLSICIKPPPPKVNDSIALKSKDNTDILPKNLESLNIKYFRESNSNVPLALPLWVKELNKLSKITLYDTEVTPEGWQTLGKLESLSCLRLHRHSHTYDCIKMNKGEFPKLRFLLIDQVTVTNKIEFHEHAAPKLEKITWSIGKKMDIKQDPISGIKYLDSLEELELNGDWSDKHNYVKTELDKHPKRRPRLTSSFPITEVTITEM